MASPENSRTKDILPFVRMLQRGIDVEKNSRTLFDHYYRWVQSFFLRRGFSKADAEDLAQETFLQLFEGIGSYRASGPFDSWLFAIAANLHRNALRFSSRSKRNAPEVSFNTFTDGLDRSPREPLAHGPSPAENTFAGERRLALSSTIAAMPNRMRACFTLFIVQGLKYREIASLLKISIDTVKAHIAQARKRLNHELGDEFRAWKE